MFDPKYPISQTIELCWDKTIQFLSRPICLFLLSSAFTISFGLWLWKRKEKQKGKKAFRVLWQSSKKLKYKDLSGRKEIKEKHPSTQAHLQGEVDTLLKTNKNILITSNSGAGKTHFATNYLRHLNKAYILIPNADDFDRNYGFIPKPPKKARYKIILLDDLHTFFSTGIERLPSFIEHAIEAGYTIWANTITGEEFEIIRNNISPKLLLQFSELSIKPTLGKDEAKKIAEKEGIKKLPDSFRGNIGEIFQDLSLQKDRYAKLDGISQSLLIVIKKLYLLGIYRPPFKMIKSDVRKLVRYYEPDISGEAITKRMDVLRVKEFISKSKDQFAIHFEEIYLKTVVEPEMKVKDFMTELSEIFPVNVAKYTQEIQTATSYEDSVKIYHSMLESNIQPNVRLFTVLIQKSGDYDIGLTWLTEMDKEKIKPDSVVYNTLINISNDFKKGHELLNKMRENAVSPDIYTLNILIRLSENFEKGESLYANMKINGKKQNNITLRSLISLPGDFNGKMKLFEQMKTEGLKPDTSTYAFIIYVSDDLEKGMELLKQMKKEGIKRDASVYGTLIHLSKDFDKGKELFDQMISDGIRPDLKIYATLLHLSKNYNDAKTILDQMIENELEPNVQIYTKLIQLSNDPEKGWELLNEMNSRGLKPNVWTFNALIWLYKDNYQIARAILDEAMTDAKVKPNVVTYTQLMSISRNFQIASALLEEMVENGIQPNDRTFQVLKALEN